MLRGEAVYELLRYLNGLAAQGEIAGGRVSGMIPMGYRGYLHCNTCKHHLGQHEAPESPNPMRCSGSRPDMNRNWCDCDGFALYYCDQPRLPTAEEIYEALQ